MIRVTCTSCGKLYQFKDEHAGLESHCPACGAKIQIPQPLSPPRSATPVPPAPQAPLPTSGMAVAALVLGILGLVTCFFPFAIIGLILGLVAINKIDNPVNRLGGRGLAQAGAIISGVGLALGVVAVAIALLLPALGAARKTARQMQNSTQLRGISQGLIIYSQSNYGFYPGLTSASLGDGEVKPAVNTYGTGGPPTSVYIPAIARLLNGSYFAPNMLIAPSETNAAIQTIDATAGATFTTAGSSYATLQVTYAVAASGGGAVHDTARAAEWHDNANSQAVVLGDRCLAPDGGELSPGAADAPASAARSIWTRAAGDWRGTVVFGDNSALILTTCTVANTRYEKVSNTNDELFSSNPGGADAKLFRP